MWLRGAGLLLFDCAKNNISFPWTAVIGKGIQAQLSAGRFRSIWMPMHEQTFCYLRACRLK